MRVLGESNENEMVLAFLRAEYHSPRYRDALRRFLGHNAHLVNRRGGAAEDVERRAVLSGWRGFGSNRYLFNGFPEEVRWMRVEVTVAEVGDMKYANWPTWVELSAGSRLVRDGAANIDTIQVAENSTTINANVKAVVREIKLGQTYPPLIAAAVSSEETLVVVEGHTRVTAYVLARQADDSVELIVAYSPAMAEWQFY